MNGFHAKIGVDKQIPELISESTGSVLRNGHVCKVYYYDFTSKNNFSKALLLAEKNTRVINFLSIQPGAI
jgi:hypothetical protein